MKAKVIALASASIAAFLLVPAATEAFYFDTPSYSPYSSSLNDFDNSLFHLQLNDVNSNLQNLNSQLNSIRLQQSLNSIDRLLDAKMGLYKTYRSIGMEVFFPTKKDGDNKPICPAKSTVFDDDLCICNADYVYDLLNSVKLDSDTVCLSKSLYSAQESASACPAHSQLSKDGKTCPCDVTYKPDPTKTSCVHVRSSSTQQPAIKCPVHSKPSKDGKSCTCDVNYKPGSMKTTCVRIRSRK